MTQPKTTIIAQTGDTHADERHRLDEHNRIMDWIGQDAAKRGATMFLHTGDVWERRSTPVERIAVADYLRGWAEHAPVLAVRGNHDHELDVQWLGRLKGRHPIRSSVSPELFSIGGCSVATLPWPDRSRLVSALPVGATAEDADAAASLGMDNVLRGIGDMLSSGSDGYPKILLAHAQISGSRLSNSQPPLVGQAENIGLESLALCKADWYALGHIHLSAGNSWSVCNATAHYAGSPRRCDYGETEEKSYTLIEFSGARLVGWERIATPCTPMLHLEATWTAGEWAEMPRLEPSGADIRFRYHVEKDQVEAARNAANELEREWLSRGALNVKLEPRTIVETRARMPEVSQARGLNDKMRAYWKAKGFDPGRRLDDLMGKLKELQA